MPKYPCIILAVELILGGPTMRVYAKFGWTRMNFREIIARKSKPDRRTDRQMANPD